MNGSVLVSGHVWAAHSVCYEIKTAIIRLCAGRQRFSSKQWHVIFLWPVSLHSYRGAERASSEQLHRKAKKKQWMIFGGSYLKVKTPLCNINTNLELYNQ